PIAFDQAISPLRTTAAETEGSLSACRSARMRSSAGARDSGAGKRPQRARHELERALHVVVVDVEVRDRAQPPAGGPRETDAVAREPLDRLGLREPERRD